MAASQLDKARKSYSYLQKTLSGGISDSDTSLTLNNNTNVPADTGVTFVIDRVDSSGTRTPTKREIVTGMLSGGNITNLVRGQDSTTAQTHANGAVVEFVLAGDLWNDLIDFMLQDHSNPGGNHKSLTDDNSNEWLERGSVASAVNQVKVTNSVTGTGPTVSASGDDTNIDLNLEGKGTGSVKTDGLPPQVYVNDAFENFIASGGIVAQSSGLIGNFSDVTYYIGGRRYTKSSVTNKTYTASRDTYVDIDINGTVTYTEVANGATSGFTLAANSIRVAKVVTNGSAITAVTQYGSDSAGNQLYPSNPVSNGWVPFTTVFTASAPMTISVSSYTATYTMIGKTVFYQLECSASVTLGGTVSNSIFFNLPVPPNLRGAGFLSVGFATVTPDNNIVGFVQLNNSGSSAIVRRSDQGTMALGSGKTLRLFGHYEAA